MPVSTFRCAEGHETEERHAMAARPVLVECATCGAEAFYTPSVGRGFRAPETAVKAAPSASAHPRDFRWREVLCCDAACAKATIEDVPIENPPEYRCEKCGGPAEVRDLAMIDRFSERFPYFDRGLGCVLTSKQHRLEVCRQQGVVPIDGDVDIEGAVRKAQARWDAEDREVLAYLDRIERDPAFAGYRRQRDIEEAEKRARRARGEAVVQKSRESG